MRQQADAPTSWRVNKLLAEWPPGGSLIDPLTPQLVNVNLLTPISASVESARSSPAGASARRCPPRFAGDRAATSDP